MILHNDSNFIMCHKFCLNMYWLKWRVLDRFLNVVWKPVWWVKVTRSWIDHVMLVMWCRLSVTSVLGHMTRVDIYVLVPLLITQTDCCCLLMLSTFVYLCFMFVCLFVCTIICGCMWICLAWFHALLGCDRLGVKVLTQPSHPT